jgi:hypothetical protein
MRGLGAVSYSLYLWHWPIITFYRLLCGYALSGPAVPLLALASLAAAVLSYRLVEQPMLRRFRGGPALPICLAGLAALGLMVAGALAVAANAARFRSFPPEVVRIAGFLDYAHKSDKRLQFGAKGCFIDRTPGFDFAKCMALDPARRNVLLLGDSHAAQLSLALAERQPGIHLAQATAAGCRPLLRTDGDKYCIAVVKAALGSLLDRGGIGQVVLAGRWRENEVDRLAETVKALRARGLAVTVVGPIVEYEDDFPKLLARATLQHDTDALGAMRDAKRAALDRAMAPRMRAAGARYVSMQRLECPDDKCRLLTRDGTPFAFDYGHLTLAAAREIAAQFPPL